MVHAGRARGLPPSPRLDEAARGPLQRAATNDCVDAAKALLAAGASLEISSGLDGDGDNAYELAKRLRSYDCIFAFDDHIAAVNA